MPIEQFDGSPGGVPGALFQFQVNQGVPPTRFWFTSEDQQDLVQVQRDWLAINWRKRQGAYKRFEYGADRFRSVWLALEDFVKDNGLGPMLPVQCEVTYINHIRTDSRVWSHANQVDLVTKLVGPGERGTTLPPREGVSINTSYIAKNEAGEPFGRFRVSVDSAAAIADSGDLAIVMNLVFVVAPLHLISTASCSSSTLGTTGLWAVSTF